MTDKRQQPLRRTEREAEQKRTRQRRRERQDLAERYEARPLLPQREEHGRYRP